MRILVAGAIAAAAVTAIVWPAGAAAACGDTLPAAARMRTEEGGTALAFVPWPAPLAIGRHFSLDVVVCAAEGAPQRALARVDADMPAHRHGMNYRPTIRALGAGRYAVAGLMFHMPGRWRFVFDLGSGADAVRLAHEVDVE